MIPRSFSLMIHLAHFSLTDFNLSVGADEDVVALDVPVDDVPLVEEHQRLKQLPVDRARKGSYSALGGKLKHEV